jgi:hypothetical protein
MILSRNHIKNAFILIAFLAILFPACKRDSPSWDTNILAPVINASLSINNLLPDTLLQKNPDSSVTLVYNSSITVVNTDSLVKIPDTTLLYSYVSFFTLNVNPGNAVMPTMNSTTTYNLGSVQLRKAIVQSGFMDVQVTSYVNQPTDFTYRITSAKLNGVPFGLHIKVPAANGNIPGRIQQSYSLANYQIDFTGPTGNSYNVIQTILSGIVDSAAGVANIQPGDSLVIRATFHNIIPYYVLGYFGTFTKTFTQQATFPLFNKITGGSLNMQNINVNLTLENEFGLDAKVDISELASVNNRTGAAINLVDPALINNTININRATQTYNALDPVNPTIQNFALTTSNSNILIWADNLPNSISYSIQVTTDPLGNVSGSNDFAFLDHGIESNLNISLPLSLIATNLTLEDTLGVTFSSTLNKTQPVKNGTLTLYATNGFPFSAGMQIYLLDNYMHITDSLIISGQTIAAGIINNNGIVVTPQNSTINIPLNSAQTQLLFNTQHIILMARFNMGCLSCLPPAYRKIYSYYLLNVKLVGNFGYRFNG